MYHRSLGLTQDSADLGSECNDTGLDAVQWATTQIADGDADVAFAGSTDAPLAELAYATLSALRILTKYEGPPGQASRPYDLHRDGMVLGEGAAVVVLEELGSDIARDAPVYAEVLGYGHGNEGGYGPRTDRTAEKARGLTRSREALARARLASRDIDHINAARQRSPRLMTSWNSLAFKAALGARHKHSDPRSSR